jgi:hypothetical protein
MLKRFAGFVCGLITILPVSAQAADPPRLIAPVHDAKAPLGMNFEWSDPNGYTTYTFVLADQPSGTILYTASIDAGNGACSSGTTCVLAPGMAGYPPSSVLNTRDFRWTVLGDGTWAIGGAGSYNYLHPVLSEVTALSASWSGGTIDVGWPAVSGAVSYHATYSNWAVVIVRTARQARARLRLFRSLRHHHRSGSGCSALQSRHREGRSTPLARAELAAAARSEQARLRPGSRRARRHVPARRGQSVVLYP